jgi:hypothetical protein
MGMAFNRLIEKAKNKSHLHNEKQISPPAYKKKYLQEVTDTGKLFEVSEILDDL